MRFVNFHCSNEIDWMIGSGEFSSSDNGSFLRHFVAEHTWKWSREWIADRYYQRKASSLTGRSGLLNRHRCLGLVYIRGHFLHFHI